MVQCAGGGVDTQKVKVEEFAAALREARAEAAQLRRQLSEAALAAAAERQPLALSPQRLPSAVKAAAQQHKSRPRSALILPTPLSLQCRLQYTLRGDDRRSCSNCPKPRLHTGPQLLHLLLSPSRAPVDLRLLAQNRPC